MNFTIPLNPITKKNSQQIVRSGNYFRIIQSKQYKHYEKECKNYMPRTDAPINYPVNVKAVYYRKDKRRVDLCNLHAALHDILVKYKVLEDDNSKIIVSTDGSKVLYDKENPRTEIFIEKVQDSYGACPENWDVWYGNTK